jgi:hypothetical protein
LRAVFLIPPIPDTAPDTHQRAGRFIVDWVVPFLSIIVAALPRSGDTSRRTAAARDQPIGRRGDPMIIDRALASS